MNTDHEFTEQNDEQPDRPGDSATAAESATTDPEPAEAPATESGAARSDGATSGAGADEDEIGADAETDATEFRPAGGRPFGFWLKLVDRRLSDEVEQVLAEGDLTRRDWRMLNLLAGKARDERLAAKLEAKPGLTHGLAERGWVEGTPPTITDAGREALDRLTGQVGAVRARVAAAVSPEDFATTIATLEAIARELGWDESQPLPRGRRGGRGFGRRHAGFGGPFAGFGGHGRGFGRGEWPGHGHGFDPRERGEHAGPGPRERDEAHGPDPREHGHGYGLRKHGHRHGHGQAHFAPQGFGPREHFGDADRFGQPGTPALASRARTTTVAKSRASTPASVAASAAASASAGHVTRVRMCMCTSTCTTTTARTPAPDA